MAYIGVDFHQTSVTTCRREADGTESFETWPLSDAALERFCLTLDANDELALEATGNSAWFRDEVISCVGRVVVVNPRQFQVIRKSVKKTDRNDARALALFHVEGHAARDAAEDQSGRRTGIAGSHARSSDQATHPAAEQDPCALQSAWDQVEEGRTGKQEAVGRLGGRSVLAA